MEEPEPVVEAVIEPVKQVESVSTFYQYVPTEPVVFAPHVPVISSQQEIDDLRQYKTLSDERFEKMGRLIADQNKMMEFLMAKLK
jgi:hypothetical protein